MSESPAHKPQYINGYVSRCLSFALLKPPFETLIKMFRDHSWVNNLSGSQILKKVSLPLCYLLGVEIFQLLLRMPKQHFKDVMHLISSCPVRTRKMRSAVKWISCRHSGIATLDWREQDSLVSSNKPRAQKVSKNTVTGWSKVQIIVPTGQHLWPF